MKSGCKLALSAHLSTCIARASRASGGTLAEGGLHRLQSVRRVLVIPVAFDIIACTLTLIRIDHAARTNVSSESQLRMRAPDSDFN